MNFYGAAWEDEILTGNLRKWSTYFQRDNRKYGEMDRILAAARSLQEAAKAWFKSGCENHEHSKMASAWYHVTYRPDYSSGTDFLSVQKLASAWYHATYHPDYASGNSFLELSLGLE